MQEIQSGVPEIYRRARLQAVLFARVLIIVLVEFGSDLSDAGGASRNDNRLPLHETLPRHMASTARSGFGRLPILQQRATVWRKPIDAGFAHGAGARDPRVRDERRAGELLPYIVDRWIEGLP
jgi:hypothetical protein